MVLSFKKIINQINENLYSCSIESSCRFKCLKQVIFRKFTFVTNKFDQKLIEQLLKKRIYFAIQALHTVITVKPTFNLKYSMYHVCKFIDQLMDTNTTRIVIKK